MNERRFHCFGTRDYRGGELVRKPNLTFDEAVVACSRAFFEYMRLEGIYDSQLPGTSKEVTYELFAALYEDPEFMGKIYSTYAGQTGVVWPVCYEAQPDGTLVVVKFTTEQAFSAYKNYYLYPHNYQFSTSAERY